MNMSEEVTNVTLQVTEKAVSTGLNATTRIAEMFARLFRELMAMSRERNASKAGRGNISGSKEKVKETDLTDLKPGYAALRDLEKSAQKTGDTIATSEHGMSREDMKAVCHKAKKYGIPVAFKNFIPFSFLSGTKVIIFAEKPCCGIRKPRRTDRFVHII